MQYTVDTDNTCKSDITEFIYRYGKVYSLRNTAILNLFQLKSTIFHKHARRNILYNLCNILKVHYNQIHSGFHSYRLPTEAGVECIIPVGSKYYINDTEYVSNKIKIVKKIRLIAQFKLISRNKLKNKND